jgi:DNA-binding NarL/FixJ family response regulator
MRPSQIRSEAIHHFPREPRRSIFAARNSPDRLRSKTKSLIKAPTKVSVLVVHESPLTRLGLTAILRSHRSFNICAETDQVPMARELVLRHQPDLVVLGLTLRQGDGLELIKDLRKLRPALRALVLTKHDDPLTMQRAFRAGARGYVLVGDPTSEIFKVIERVLAGEVCASGSMTHRLVQNLARGAIKPNGSEVSALSDRELQVFSLFGRGFGATRLAGELHLSVKTIETHQMRIKEKLGLRSAAELCESATLWMSRVAHRQLSVAR